MALTVHYEMVHAEVDGPMVHLKNSYDDGAHFNPEEAVELAQELLAAALEAWRN